MKRFTNPLDNIRIASPCPASWDEMRGDERKRFCSQCSLNVYNLSGMTRDEAENLLLMSEGGVCVRFYRRADGTVLTEDCPVGWRAVRRRVSRAATAFVSLCAGIFAGIFAFNQPKTGTPASVAAESSPARRAAPPSFAEAVKAFEGDASAPSTEGWSVGVPLTDLYPPVAVTPVNPGEARKDIKKKHRR
jgi:hypothetical protein